MDNPFPIQDDSVVGGRLSGRRKTNWVESIFTKAAGVSQTVSQTVRHEQSAHFVGRGVSYSRLTIFMVILSIGVGLLFARAGYLQVVQGDDFQSLAEGNRIRVLATTAPRGVFFDRYGRQLARNIASYNVFITPADLPDSETAQQQVFSILGQSIDLPANAVSTLVKNRSAGPYQPVLIAQGLTYEQILAVSLAQNELPGVFMREGFRRQYSLETQDGIAQSLSHLFGYTGLLNQGEYQTLAEQGYALNDIIGKSGLERQYEAALRGTPGRQQVEVTAAGRLTTVIAEDPPVPGQDITLAIDAELQQQSEAALRSVLEQYNKKRGAVVALNPQNGEVLALVSLPSFDANEFAAGIASERYSQLLNDPDKPLFNRAVAGVYPSGSTIKPVMVIAALAEGIITPQTTFLSVGGIAVKQWFFPDWKAGGHGLTNAYTAIAESVNTFFYSIGGGVPRGGNPANGYEFEGLGPYRITQWLERFGLGRASGLDFPQENSGFVPSVEWKNDTYGELWYIGDTYNLSIGQGNLLVTPLQVANWTAVVANGGTLYQPRLALRIGDEPVPPVVITDQIAPPDAIAVAQEGMRQTVLRGSAQSFQSLPITAAAKTGTAQWSNAAEPHAWFASYAPFENPEIVVVTLVEEGEEGSRTAAAVARQILQAYAQQR